jgi:hypothetical protein
MAMLHPIAPTKLVTTNTTAHRLVTTNYTDYLGFTLRYLYGLNTGL